MAASPKVAPAPPGPPSVGPPPFGAVASCVAGLFGVAAGGCPAGSGRAHAGSLISFGISVASGTAGGAAPFPFPPPLPPSSWAPSGGGAGGATRARKCPSRAAKAASSMSDRAAWNLSPLHADRDSEASVASCGSPPPPPPPPPPVGTEGSSSRGSCRNARAISPDLDLPRSRGSCRNACTGGVSSLSCVPSSSSRTDATMAESSSADNAAWRGKSATRASAARLTLASSGAKPEEQSWSAERKASLAALLSGSPPLASRSAR
mmetsp:Transcript_22920/g.73358  ORF Transcript_22920/g.73358 Transcript_22920/m.73358 type:complete len:263 (-) Transcript_22920:480-1268(-)